MYENRKDPENLREFLTHLPTYADNDYNDIVSYIVWKTVKLCLTTEHDKIDWRSIVNLLESDTWNDPQYMNILDGKRWKDLDKHNNTDNYHKGTMCNHQCLPAETVYYCFTCTVNPLYEICDNCFDPNEHIDHEYTARVITRTEGRLCHCGNESVFKKKELAFKCKNKVNNDYDDYYRSNNTEGNLNPILKQTFDDMIDYIIDVILSTNELRNSAMPGLKHFSTGAHTSSVGHTALASDTRKDSIFNEILIETTDSQNMIYESYASNMNINEMWTIQLNNEDNQVHIMDLASKISKVLNKPIGYAISICNKLTENYFPAILAKSTDYEKIKEIYESFHNENIVVHIRRLHDVFKVNLMEDLVHFLYNLSTDRDASYGMKYTLRSCMLDSWKPKNEHVESGNAIPLKTKINLFGGFLSPGECLYTPSSSKDAEPVYWFHSWNFEDCQDQALDEILKEYDRDISMVISDMSRSNICFFRGSRFQYLATEFIVIFSRVASLHIMKVFCTLFSLTDNARQYLAAQYYDIYLAIVYRAVASDSVGIRLAFMSLVSQYTFQDPKLSNLAIRSGFVERTLKFSFTLLAFNSEDLLLSTSRRLASHQPNYEESPIPKLSAVKEKVCNHITEVVRFQVGIDSQSFLNPTAYLLKSILQWSQCGRYEAISKEITNYVDFHKFLDDKVQGLYISEASLSTLVLIGQINVGFWVRNGSPIILQKRMYTNYNMRELTYMSDIFNVQFSMCMSDPDDFMVTFLTRWGLKSWSNGTPMGDYPDNETTVGIVNECLLLFIQLLTEIKTLIVVSSIDNFERTLKSEIIHAVGFNRCTYAQIMDTIPDHITKHSIFDKYLEEYADFTPAVSGAEAGTFHLKEKYVGDLDPYYLGLSSSKRYEIEKCIRNHMSVKENRDFVDTFIPVKQVCNVLKETAYFNLYSISSTNTFGIFLKSTLEHIKKCKYDGLLPRVIHLIHLCVVNNLNDFMKVFWHEHEIIDTEFYHFHSIGSILYALLLDDNYSNVQGKIREIFRVLSERAPHININGYLSEQAVSFNPELLKSSKVSQLNKEEEHERKKKQAQARRDKILRKFSKQQMKFIEKNIAANVALKNVSKSERMSDENVPSEFVGWSYPEDYCVFCKTDMDEDPFVYFSFQENNICDFGIDMANPSSVINEFSWILKSTSELTSKNKMENIHERPILRVCGHGSHIKCLGNHMKSAIKVHSQTTKNIPSSYGFGLIFCPVCNSLMNSYLPKLIGSNTRCGESFWKGDNQNFDCSKLSDKLSVTCKKACHVFVKLAGYDIEDRLWQTSYETVSNLLVNSISNLELRLRSFKGIDGNDNDPLLVNNIPNRSLLTFRLLSDLLIFAKNNIKDTDSILHANKWIFKYQTGTFDSILSFSNTIFTQDTSLFAETVEDKISSTIYAQMEENITLFCRGLLEVDFYRELTYEEVPWNNIVIETTQENKLTEYNIIGDILSEHLKFFNYPENDRSWKSNKLCKCFHLWLQDTIKTFLKRLLLSFQIHYSIFNEITRFENNLTTFSDMITYLTHGKINDYGELLENYWKYYIPEVNLKYRSASPEEMVSLFSKLKNDLFPAVSSAHLINLPHKFSAFYTNPDYDANKIERLLGGETALCLLCGSTVNIQKPVALHSYKIGECTNHLLNECESDSNYGLFLMLRTNVAYIAYGDRGTFYHSPYVNKYGDVDEDLRYGTPVFLDTKKYENLSNEIFLDNMIPHVVFRATDGDSDQGGWTTL
ncbi:hypothetical protein C6P45_002888 [Maudiozyma exigua]|uniref:E3 ubiquitin-protein ligase n=1 Tax=Maudiozyma exigua TaxID=34358 RepID=A0A9P6VWI4_MAUEX|nr:hypothetical protein C6P45_002888 [Kazachstania exigua]